MVKAFGASKNMPGPQTVKLLAANRIFQYTKKGNFYSECSPEVDN
jgi:hypothetical protein